MFFSSLKGNYVRKEKELQRFPTSILPMEELIPLKSSKTIRKWHYIPLK
jgi:hypothetical protein